MPYTADYASAPPARADIDADTGLLVLEFGAPWCGHCQLAQAAIAEVLGAAAEVRHLKIEDGRGRPLGRSFRVKLWPTLLFLRDGEEQARLVRPREAREVAHALGALLPPGSS
ncbi:MAG TPA: thioredoxin family protein [Xanthomonadaceae bacterium]|nr:thioredoxin family protein [Xanthomonadaceae bacterium]